MNLLDVDPDDYHTDRRLRYDHCWADNTQGLKDCHGVTVACGHLAERNGLCAKHLAAIVGDEQ